MKLSGVTTQRQIKLKDLPLSKFNSEILRQIKANNRKVNTFVFKYESNGKKVAGFLIVPKKMSGKLPCVIFNRGGYKDFGIIKMGQLFMNLADIVAAGYVIIGSQNRGNSISEGKDEYGSDSDIKAVTDLYPIIKKNKFIDSTRIGMLGWSRGGMTTYRCLTKVKWIKAVAVGGGVTNFSRNAKLRPDMAGVFKEAFGGSIKEMKKRSALFWVDKLPKKTPILLMHGTADWHVTPIDSLEMGIELYKNKIPYRLIMFEGGDHGLTEFKEEFVESIIDWFDRFLKTKNPELPNLKPHGE